MSPQSKSYEIMCRSYMKILIKSGQNFAHATTTELPEKMEFLHSFYNDFINQVRWVYGDRLTKTLDVITLRYHHLSNW